MASSSTSRRRLCLLSIASRIAILCLIYVSSFLPVFDTAADTILPRSTSRLTNALLRWDAFHFVHIAGEGYVYEYEWAFFSGIAIAMRLGGWAVGLVKTSLGVGAADEITNALQGGAVLAFLCNSTVVLYDLSMEVFSSENIAYLSALLSLLPSNPATLRFAPYSEPFFTYFSYRGMLFSLRSRYLEAAVFFALASTFRSNGVLLAGYIIWPLLLVPLLRHERPSSSVIIYAILLSLLIASPLIAYQIAAYRLFCFPPNPRPWCSNIPPSIYTYVQSTYWDVGFLRYWQVAQIPNFLMAAPVYALLFSFCWFHLSRRTPSILATVLGRKEPEAMPDSFLSTKLTPFVIHAFVLTSMLLLSSHVQIILRVAASLPVVYWAAAWLLTRDKTATAPAEKAKDQDGNKALARSSGEHANKCCMWKWGRMYVRWSVVWGALSVVLWTTGLPPA